jgi:hypothetical protein
MLCLGLGILCGKFYNALVEIISCFAHLLGVFWCSLDNKFHNISSFRDLLFSAQADLLFCCLYRCCGVFRVFCFCTKDLQKHQVWLRFPKTPFPQTRLGALDLVKLLLPFHKEL